MRHLSLLLWPLLACLGEASGRFEFTAERGTQIVAEIELSSPGADWAVRGREAAVALVQVDGMNTQHVIAWAGPVRTVYRVFLGAVASGRHTLSVSHDKQQSAKQAGLQVHGVTFRQYPKDQPEHDVLSHAPVLYERRNAAGRFSDVPLVAYCERLMENGQPVLEYTVIFSNEDGGTSTRALMARWGRTTDIEYVYKVYLRGDGARLRAIVQGPGHKDLEFKGPYEEAHPLLMPVTDNNMVASATRAGLRFQLAPALVDLTSSSRETVMDANPATYTAMAKELEREGKLRSFGTVEEEKISNLRNYAFVDYTAKHASSALRVKVLLRDGRAFASDLGRNDFAIAREGAVRTTVELPPGTEKENIGTVGFECIVPPPPRRADPPLHSGSCTLEKVNGIFFLDEEYRPGQTWLKVSPQTTLPTGQTVLLQP